MTVSTVRLEEALCIADTGTWGDASTKQDGTPVLRSSNIQKGQLLLEDVAWRRVPAKHIDSKRLANGDLIITMSSGSPAHIGKCCVFTQPEDGNPYYFSNFTLRLRAHPDKADPKWLFHWLSSPGGRAVLDAMNSTTSGLRNLNRKLYLAQKIPLPPLPKQRRIAAILDKADAVRRKRQQTLDLADDFLRSAFLDLFGDPVTNPKGWPVVRLADLVAGPVRNGLSPSKSGTHAGEVLTLSAITGPRFAPESRKMALFDIEPPQEKMVDSRDFLVCRGNGNINLVGKGAFPLESMTGVLFPDTMIGLRLDTEEVAKSYMQMIWQSGAVRGQIVAKARTTSGIHKVNQQTLRSTTLPLPPIDEQLRFDKVAARVYGLRMLFKTDPADALLASLTQRAFRGKL